ncbi:hypothetical protein AAEX28_12075 [Lentisphaerota bacterium WC36G]|nr:hypothetical protein LJT99_14910 [Lentisphaerae bacterium WC36]
MVKAYSWFSKRINQKKLMKLALKSSDNNVRKVAINFIMSNNKLLEEKNSLYFEKFLGLAASTAYKNIFFENRSYLMSLLFVFPKTKAYKVLISALSDSNKGVFTAH